ncbi:hypothetical protein [Roseimaritima sediminicola]|uniref:hypothetical protein n=1 Tax=Roseimaritima sediminicola TaxID=2662066 RepID=UPI0012983F4D|nr:hypothetical protein [Roseimaritima sediminicola]
MKRLALMAMTLMLLGTPAFAISEFSKQWKAHYLGDDVSDEFKRAGRRAGCYVCHVKGKKKEEARNEYGMAMSEFLDHEDFPKERIKAEPEKVKAEILEAFKKTAEKKSKDGKKFGEKIKEGELPATDAGL